MVAGAESFSGFATSFSPQAERHITAIKSRKIIRQARRKNKDANPMNYVAAKFICSFVILFLVVISDVLQRRNISLINLFVAFSIGFFVPDILLFSRRFIRKKEMENDLLKAVTIMNNSFKSGRSIIQTIEIVSEELDGPLQEECLLCY